MPKHIFFDLDNTLMLSRTEMAAGHMPLFKQLCDQKDVVVVSGAQGSQIRKQIPERTGAHFYILGQTGNQAISKDGIMLWKETVTAEQTQVILAVIDKIKRELHLKVKDENDLIENRGAQISYSPIGHNEDVQKKYAFDPTQEMRRQVVKRHKDDVKRLNALCIDVAPGGTTCFDFFLRGKNKGYNIARLIEHEGWKKDECLYVGDALFPGGNDETVIGVIPTHAVKNPDETFAFVAEMLK